MALTLTLRPARPSDDPARALYASLGFHDEPSPSDPNPILMRAARAGEYHPTLEVPA